MKRMTICACLALATAAQAAEFTGPVVGVHDGDTLTVLHGGKDERIRLVEIDAPELRQDFGQASKQSLSDLCFGTDATVRDQGLDRYGRTLGRVFCGGVDANAAQIERGLAWWYVKYGHDDALQAAEDVARTARIGLWSRPDAIPPWEYRHGGR